MPLEDRALVVGIDLYPGIGKLAGAENDANAFHEWVTHPAGGNVDPAYVKKLVSSDFPSPASTDLAEPAKKAIEAFFTEVDEAAEANNAAFLGAKAGRRLWMYFSGHGFAPSLDRSGVLMANATARRVHNIAPRMWADRLYEGGWFDEVILFQDACRNRFKDADLNPPFLLSRQAPAPQVRRRFYAFAATNNKLAKEIVLPNGETGGVFTATLLDGLRGGARDPETLAVTTNRLMEYLQANMKKLLSPEDLDNVDIAQMPDVVAPDPFDIVPPGGASVAKTFPVQILVSRSGPAASILNGAFATVLTTPTVPAAWNVDLPVGLYKVVVQGVGNQVFEVDGGLDVGNAPITEVVHV